MMGLFKLLFGLSGEQIGPHEAVQRMNAGAVLVDVREAHEFASGHAPKAHHLPLSRTRAGHTALLQTLKLPPEIGEILLICESGVRSRLAQASLSRATECRYVNVSGGMNAWLAAGLPVSRGAARG